MPSPITAALAREGAINPLVACMLADIEASSCYTQSTAPPPFQTATTVGYGTTLSQLVKSTAPDKGVGLTLSIPLRNREAQAKPVARRVGIPSGPGEAAPVGESSAHRSP